MARGRHDLPRLARIGVKLTLRFSMANRGFAQRSQRAQRENRGLNTRPDPHRTSPYSAPHRWGCGHRSVFKRDQAEYGEHRLLSGCVFGLFILLPFAALATFARELCSLPLLRALCCSVNSGERVLLYACLEGRGQRSATPSVRIPTLIASSCRSAATELVDVVPSCCLGLKLKRSFPPRPINRASAAAPVGRDPGSRVPR